MHMTNQTLAILFIAATPISFMVGFLTGLFVGLNLKKGGRQ